MRLAALRSDPQAFSSKLEYEQDLDEDGWRTRLASRAQFAAWAGDRVVGIVGGVPSGDGQAAELISMWVRPNSRAAGIGSRLIQAVVDWAKVESFAEVRLWVVEGNSRAESLYERCGFNRTGKADVVREGEPELEYEMSRKLDP